MSTGILTQPAELDDMERDLRDITKRAAELSQPMTPQERRDAVFRDEVEFNKVVDRIVYGGAAAMFLVVVAVATWRHFA